MVDWNLLVNYLRPQWPLALLLTLLLLSNIGLQPVNAQIMRSFLDMAKQGSALVCMRTRAVGF
jgi:hypothetical protein